MQGWGFVLRCWFFQKHLGVSNSRFVLLLLGKIEVAAANAAGFNRGRCRYSALCIAYGESGHPFVRAIRELCELWCKLVLPLVKEKNKFLDEVAVAWQLIKAVVNPKDEKITFKNSLSKVQGVLSQVIIFLYCLGWRNPITFDKWVSPSEDTWHFLNEGHTPFPIHDMIKELEKRPLSTG